MRQPTVGQSPYAAFILAPKSDPLNWSAYLTASNRLTLNCVPEGCLMVWVAVGFWTTFCAIESVQNANAQVIRRIFIFSLRVQAASDSPRGAPHSREPSL